VEDNIAQTASKFPPSEVTGGAKKKYLNGTHRKSKEEKGGGAGSTAGEAIKYEDTCTRGGKRSADSTPGENRQGGLE